MGVKNPATQNQNLSLVGQQTPIPTPLQPQSDVQKKDNNFFKIFIHVLALVLLLGFGSFGFWFYQTKKITKEPEISPASFTKSTPNSLTSPTAKPDAVIPECKPDEKKYVNNYIGLSFCYSSNLEYYRTTKEEAFSGSVNEYFKESGSNKKDLFNFYFIRKKFNKDNHYEQGWDIKQISSNLIINPIYAMTAPQDYLIKDIKEKKFNDNIYYTYDYSLGKNNYSVYIYPRNDCYYKFTFNKDNEVLIKNILSSVMYNDSVYLNIFKLGKTISNPGINLEELYVPLGWEYENTDDETKLFYKGKLGEVTVKIVADDKSELYKYLKERCDYRTDRSSYDVLDNEIEEIKNKFGCEKVNYSRTSGTKRSSIFCTTPQQPNGSYKTFSYIGGLKIYFTAEYKPDSSNTDNIIGMYVDQILKSKAYDLNKFL